MIEFGKEVDALCSHAIQEGYLLRDFIRLARRTFIVAVLDRHQGNGMHRNTLQREMHLLNIPSTGHRGKPHPRQWAPKHNSEASVA